MGKPFKDKLKNVGDFISGTIAEVEKQAKGSEVLDKISKGTKDGLVFVSNGVKDGAEKITNGAKTSADTIKNVVAEHKKQGTQDDNKEKQGSLDDQLHDAVNRYNVAYAEFENNGSAILRQRERSVDLQENVENLINSIANHPKNFDADFKEIHLYKKEFKDVCDYAIQELDAAKKSMAGVGAGIAGGMAVASLAPSAAMWVATTFGTASTGTAISTLSGAAATNAALAWLGGGAAAAGGGGMASGTAFLAMAGPVGWTIGGATLLASIALFANKKIKLGKEKKEEIEAVLHNVELVSEVNVKMRSLLDKTDKLRSMLNDQYGNCMTYYGKNFIEIADEGQMLLGTLVNNAKSLAATLGIAEQAYQLKQGNVDEQRFIENSEMLCLDASVSALSSFAGQVLIPVPVLGTVIGNTVGTMMYQIAKDNLSAREQKIFEEYAETVRQLDVSLQDQYQKFVDEIGKDTKLFMELLNRAFAPDIRVAFEGSIDLAKSCRVPVDEILDSKEKIVSFFMD